MRPKCTVLDETGHLAIGKFPSIADSMNVTRAEVLALRLARRAGIDVPEAWRLIAYLCVGYPAEEHADPELVRHGWQAREEWGAALLER